MSNSGPINPGTWSAGRAAPAMEAGDRRIAYILAHLDEARRRALEVHDAGDTVRALLELEATLRVLIRVQRGRLTLAVIEAGMAAWQAEVQAEVQDR